MNLRIGVIVAGVLLGAASRSSAQQMVMGVMGGATYSDFENPDTDSRWGGTGGLIFGISTYRSVSLLEVSYTQRGDSDIRIDYIETGITGGAAVGSPSGARGRFYGGITVSFPIACEGSTIIASAFCDGTKTTWEAPLGLMLGRWSGGGAFVGLDVRYSFPLSDAGFEVYNNPWAFRLVIGRAKERR